MSEKTKKEVKPILDRPNIVRTKVKIKGLTSLIVNAVNEEVVNSILKTQTTGKSARREPKNVENEFRKSLYPQQNGHHVFKSVAVKKSIIGAAHTFAPNIPKTLARGVFIPIDWLVIEGSEPTPRQDMVRVGMKKADIRIRAEFKEWEMEVPLEFDENGPMTLDMIINLLDIAGHNVGIGDWRPSCGGMHGRFEVISG